MADPNPLDVLLHSDTDESVVNALVASLESRLASPTNKEQSLAISNPSVNSNHVSNATVNSACTPHTSAQNNNVHVQSLAGNINNSDAKTVVKDNQILGINSIQTTVSVTCANSPVNSHGTASPKPLNSVNKPTSPAVQIITNNSSHGTTSVVTNAHLSRTTPPPVQSTVNSLVSHSNSVVATNPQTAQNDHVINRTTPSPSSITTVHQGLVQQNVVRNPQNVVINSASQPFTQKTNVHIVHSANVTSVITQPGSNPSVITVRGQTPTSQITAVRPQIVTSNINATSPRPPANVRIQANRMPNTPQPIRIASTTNQITIAPRPGSHPVSIQGP